MRAIRARYNPYMQTQARVAQLRSLGHSVDKVEFIVMGGTFLSMDAGYRCEPRHASCTSYRRTRRTACRRSVTADSAAVMALFRARDYFIRNLHDALSGHTSNSVEEAIAYSEQSKTRCIGITIETRPDYCLKPHLNSMLAYGCTRIEIGVQVSARLGVSPCTPRLTHAARCAEHLRGRCPRHQQGTHGSRCMQLLPAGQRVRVQGCNAHDA